jgi:CheY-like chemotaxis protein
VPFEWRGEIIVSVNIGDTLGNARILIVDDEPEITEYFAELLKSYYINADTANSGAEAVKLAEQAKSDENPYNIAFIDWKMPEISGVDTLKRIEEIIPECHCVIISAYNWDEIKESIHAFEIDYMPKPIPPSEIYNKIINLLDVKVVNASQTDFTDKKILLVEDVEINRVIVTALLEKTGCKIDEAENGLVALDMIKLAAESGIFYDLILMDMQMPVMDGLTATRVIRKFNTEVPIIAMTANAFREDAEACLAAGMNEHIAKPIDNETFMRTLSAYLKNQ